MDESNAFGAWFRDRRKLLDITQEELAERVGCNYDYIRKIESGSRHASKAMAKRIGEQLGLSGDELQEFIRLARGGAGMPTMSTGSAAIGRNGKEPHPGEAEGAETEPALPPTNLPSQRTPFVGREEQVARVRELLQSERVRLLTLTGPPGIGKTRLSFEVAASLRAEPEYVDGVFYVPLAPVTDHKDVLPAIARELGIKEMPGQRRVAMISDYLREKKMLLVLDNFEQVVEAGEFIADILAVCPGLKVMISSREVLHVYGEQEYAVPPMQLPDRDEASTVEGVEQCEAVRLFVQRAQAVDPDFKLTESNAQAVVEICHQLDGLPLAIELAASRVKTLPPQALLSRLNSRLKVLNTGALDLPPRQRTLRGAISWSYDLLEEWEQVFFRRASILLGATIDSAEAVCTLEGEEEEAYGALDGISSLLDKSLLRRLDSNEEEPHFWMLWTIREYAREKLAQSGEEERVRRGHARYFVQLAEEAEPHLTSAGRDPWMVRLDEEMDNLRAAMEWSLEEGRTCEEREIGLRTAGALGWYWFFKGYYTEGRRWLEAFLKQVADDDETLPVAKALFAVGHLTWGWFVDADAPTQAKIERSVRIYRHIQDTKGVAFNLAYLGIAAARRGEEAEPISQESMKLLTEIGDRWGLAYALHQAAIAQIWSDKLDIGSLLHEKSLRTFRDIADNWGIAMELGSLGRLDLSRRNYESAANWLNQALALERQVGDKWLMAQSERNLGDSAYLLSQYDEASQYYERSLQLYRDIGDQVRVATLTRALGHVERHQGRPQAAEELYCRSLLIMNGTGHTSNLLGILWCLAALATLHLAYGSTTQAVKLVSLVDKLIDPVFKSAPTIDQIEYDHTLSVLHDTVSAMDFDKAWEEGKTMSLVEAIAYASQSTIPSVPST